MPARLERGRTSSWTGMPRVSRMKCRRAWQRAETLDPRDPEVISRLVGTLRWVRDWHYLRGQGKPISTGEWPHYMVPGIIQWLGNMFQSPGSVTSCEPTTRPPSSTIRLTFWPAYPTCVTTASSTIMPRSKSAPPGTRRTISCGGASVPARGTNLAQGFETFVELPWDPEAKRWGDAARVNRAFLDWLRANRGRRFAEGISYPMAINIIFYVMTH